MESIIFTCLITVLVVDTFFVSVKNSNIQQIKAEQKKFSWRLEKELICPSDLQSKLPDTGRRSMKLTWFLAPPNLVLKTALMTRLLMEQTSAKYY